MHELNSASRSTKHGRSASRTAKHQGPLHILTDWQTTALATMTCRDDMPRGAAAAAAGTGCPPAVAHRHHRVHPHGLLGGGAEVGQRLEVIQEQLAGRGAGGGSQQAGGGQLGSDFVLNACRGSRASGVEWRQGCKVCSSMPWSGNSCWAVTQCSTAQCSTAAGPSQCSAAQRSTVAAPTWHGGHVEHGPGDGVPSGLKALHKQDADL